jgi:hypothetical protein
MNRARPRGGARPRERQAASVAALPPSYMLAFETSMPVSCVTSVWYSKNAWRLPWLASAW